MGEKGSACRVCLQQVGRAFVLPRVILDVAVQAAQHVFISSQLESTACVDFWSARGSVILSVAVQAAQHIFSSGQL